MHKHFIKCFGEWEVLKRFFHIKMLVGHIIEQSYIAGYCIQWCSCEDIQIIFWIHKSTYFTLVDTEAQRYHCKCNCTTACFILQPRVLSYCRKNYFTGASFIFTAASFILAPWVLFYCCKFYFSTASFILLPRDLLYRREFHFAAASFIFTTASFIFTTCSKIKLAVVKIKLAVVKIKIAVVKQNSRQ